MRINAAWIFLTLGFGTVVYFAVQAFIAKPDTTTLICILILVACGGVGFKLCYHQTTSGKGKVAK